MNENNESINHQFEITDPQDQTGNFVTKAEKSFKPDIKDGIFAILVFFLGYFFSRWVFFSWQGIAVAVFTTVYCISTALYMMKKGVRFNREGWFWLAVTWLTGLSFALWSDRGFEGIRVLFLFCTAVYWVMCQASVQITGKTGNLLFLDGINAVFVIPFRNIINQYRCITVFKSREKTNKKKHLSILLGIVLALLVIFLVTPLLLAADSGGFSKIVNAITKHFQLNTEAILKFLFYLVPAIPVSAYLFGLIFGCANKKGNNSFSEVSTNNAVSAVRIISPPTLYILLGSVCVLYVIFISAQLPYFFSAFAGERPDGWLYYSEYARHGFFELCQIAAINLSLLTVANLMSKKHRNDSKLLKIFNIILMLETLLLIVTAFSKMGMYIDAYGLTMYRLLPCVFMVFLIVVCIGVLFLQRFQFSIVRLSAIVGAVMLCILCLGEPNGFVVQYNTDRYLSGTLTDYDIDILFRAGAAGVGSAVKIYEQIDDKALRADIKEYLLIQKTIAEVAKGTLSDTLQNELALDKIRKINLN